MKLEDRERTPLSHDVSDTLIGFVPTALFIGQFFGPFMIINLSNSKGRKPCLLLSTAAMCIAYILLTSATHITTIIIGRIICGLGTSMANVLSSVYIGEIASTNIRGILLNGSGLFLTFGCLLVYSVGPFVPYYAVSLLGLVISLAQFVCIYYFVPESPIFHAMNGMEKEAADTLEKLNRREDIDLFLTRAKEQAKLDSHLKELFSVKCNRRAFFITTPLGVLLQLSGVIVVTFYATTIFDIAGSSIEPHIATILIGLTQFLSSAICPTFVELGGRKVLMMVSTSICSVSLAAFGVFFYLSWISHPVVDSIRWLPLLSLIVFFIGLDTGFGIIPMTLPGEMFSPSVRTIGTIIGFQTAIAFGLLLSAIFPYMLYDMGAHYTFWIFSFVCAFSCFYTAMFVPETKGKSLFEIQEILSR
ncbi:facilitated trehalose transporter Tret1-like isoform X2 [Plodia interpunctella]|nr:facilitated trehalose transporter Tret1-like isoform X2 [Plodia interpunctella]